MGEYFGNLGILGEQTDPLLDRSINYVLTGVRGDFHSRKKEYPKEISNSKLTTLTGNNMYLEFK